MRIIVGGTIRFSIEYGKVALQLDEYGMNELTMLHPARSNGGALCDILVIDDDPDCRESYLDALGTLGYSCIGASDAASALRLIAEQPQIGIVLTDLAMPGMDGISFLDEVAARFEASRPIVVVAITGFGSLDIAIQVMRLNGADFLSKPVSIDDLRAAVRRAASRWSRLAVQFRL